MILAAPAGADGGTVITRDIHAVLKNHDVIEAYLGNSDAHPGAGEPPSLEVRG